MDTVYYTPCTPRRHLLFLVPVAVLVFLLSLASSAWSQTTQTSFFDDTANLQVLKTYIANDPVLNAKPNNIDGASEIAVALNLTPTSPAFVVWRTNVGIGEVGRAFNATELAGLTSLNTQRLQNLAAWLSGGVNPSLAPVRQFFDDIFSGAGGVNTRAALLALWKRNARRIESVFATGSGTNGSPGTLVYEGVVNYTIVNNARNLP